MNDDTTDAPHSAAPDDLDGALVIDVRRAAAFEQASHTLPGASWHDPALVDTWGAALPVDRPIVVYCVHGHEVSQTAAGRLRGLGLDARYLRGGIDGWQAAGRPVAPKGAAS